MAGPGTSTTAKPIATGSSFTMRWDATGGNEPVAAAHLTIGELSGTHWTLTRAPQQRTPTDSGPSQATRPGRVESGRRCRACSVPALGVVHGLTAGPSAADRRTATTSPFGQPSMGGSPTFGSATQGTLVAPPPTVTQHPPKRSSGRPEMGTIGSA